MPKKLMSRMRFLHWEEVFAMAGIQVKSWLLERALQVSQYTTLFSGYSMIPSAPSALSCGMISRTIFSSITVSTATQSHVDKVETVGLRNDGSDFSNASSWFFGMFIFSPTLS